MAGLLETQTRAAVANPLPPGPVWVPGLTVLYHPDLGRIGERVPLPALASGRSEELSRSAPAFGPVAGGRLRPLADPYLSRRPFVLRPNGEPGGVTMERGDSPTPLAADGEPVAQRVELSAEAVRRGVVLLLGGRIVLLLSLLDPVDSSEAPDCGLVGESAEMLRLRRELIRYAPLSLPVLLRGETGTGKELAARALHLAGRQAHGPFVAVNMGAVPPTLAASELFGAVRGAFTGADRKRTGTFQRADGGTLFLDEIGETPPEVQGLLLRALETGEVTPVGGDEAARVAVRLIAATDANLEADIEAGRFRAPLLHRLAGCEVRLPPLAARRDDFGRLLLHFLREELAACGEEYRLRTPAEDNPWIPASLVAQLALAPWPGNVRQLRNVVRQLVANGRDAGEAGMWLATERLARESPRPAATPPPEPTLALPHLPAMPSAPVKKVYRRPEDIGDDELLAALRAHRWRIQPAAAALGMSRPSLYDRIERSSVLRKAADVGREEILATLERAHGDLDAAVEMLEVSKRGLQRRMTQLGIGSPGSGGVEDTRDVETGEGEGSGDGDRLRGR